MFTTPRFLPAAVFAVSIAVGAPVLSQDEPTAATVVAKVGETEITLGHMLALRSGLPPHYNELPDEVLFNGILDQLIQQTLLMQIVGDNPSPMTSLMIENETRALLASEAIRGVMDLPVSEDDLKAAYAARYADEEPETEYHAAHILVETEDEAKDIITKLDEGADFGDLAKTLSTGPSGPNGGDLGWFGPGVMVESFFNAAAALDAGEVSAPVETQFGWHVIKMIETRDKDIPTLDQVREELQEELRQKIFDDLIAQRESETAIDRAGADGIDQAIIKSTDILEN
ncbi:MULTISPECIES: peptidylprolyl isomerase [unclassified Roseovarius]|uniref:peptidylprolyl isomerase n=1 Tax=unclassified Roseovarius TaxID=2614913 RepID=UPI00273E7076|nr:MULTISPECIES: peptidylprolyl isomerase [unclassified Roseovarius]